MKKAVSEFTEVVQASPDSHPGDLLHFVCPNAGLSAGCFFSLCCVLCLPDTFFTMLCALLLNILLLL